MPIMAFAYLYMKLNITHSLHLFVGPNSPDAYLYSNMTAA